MLYHCHSKIYLKRDKKFPMYFMLLAVVFGCVPFVPFLSPYWP